MEEAFNPGYDPALELVTYSAETQHRVEREDRERVGLELNLEDSEPCTQHIKRKDQAIVDRIVKGEETGHYFVLLGAKVMWHPSPFLWVNFLNPHIRVRGKQK